MWGKKSVAIIFPTYREKGSIYNAISEFDDSGYVDEIIVVDNNAEVGTEEEVKKTRAVIIKEHRQGFGFAVRKGIASTRADLIIIAEPDATFKGRDVIKFLSYSDDFDMVFGSRTHVPLIEQNSQMTFLRRMADVFLGRLISVLFLCPPMTDVGCIFRLTSRRGWRKIAKECKANNAMLPPEWQLVAAKNRIRFMEIPVNFKARVGRSSITATFFDQAKWGILIFFYILKVWIFSLLRKKLYRKNRRKHLAFYLRNIVI